MKTYPQAKETPAMGFCQQISSSPTPSIVIAENELRADSIPEANRDRFQYLAAFGNTAKIITFICTE
jgi:hypothetical protein